MSQPFTIAASLYLPMSLLTFCTYAWDKHQAKRNRRRIPEHTLHLLELLCGWPGAFAAQFLLRHKLRKLPYMLVFTLIILAHLLAWAAWFCHR